MDYTPVNYNTALGHTTWAHETALAVLFTSYLEHPADHWGTYRDTVAKDFLRAVPTVWDETRLLEGAPDQYATMARRSGEDWYIGSIVGSDQSRTVSIALDFLASGVTYTAAIYKDGGSDAEIAYETQMVTRGTVLSIPLRKNGGLAIRITKQESAPAPPRYYRIVNRNSGKVLAVQNASLEDVASVVQWDYVDATTNDEWRLVDAGGGYYTLLNRSSGKALDVNGAVPDDGATLIQYKSRGTSNQQWQIIPPTAVIAAS